MADEEQNNQEENEQVEETAEETVSAPEGPVAPAAESEEPAAEEPAAEKPVAEKPVAEELAAESVAEEAGVEEAPAGEAESVEEVETEAEAPAEAPQEVRRKRKRLARAQRHRHSKPKRERPAERKAITRVPKPEHPRGRRQERRGVVISSGMDKTIVVRVDAVKAHPKYLKVVRRSTKFHAHDEQNQAKVGDVVRIVETRPLSKTKNWRLAEIVEVAK
jgi:small subunit ribosomal protein S17